MRKEKIGMERITDYFGSLVFDDNVMKARLSPEIYESLKKTVDEGEKLDVTVAAVVAEAAKTFPNGSKRSARSRSSCMVCG